MRVLQENGSPPGVQIYERNRDQMVWAREIVVN